MEAAADAHSSDNGGDVDFYEDIEAPKFVDFKALHHYCPDDRYWFCSRVGCDQKHEEEMDSETIYKNFVLRVMAARSPNVRYRKTLTRKPNTTLKCPLSAPPKSSKPRVPRLAVLSSISGKLVNGNEKLKPTRKPNATPSVKAKQPSAAAKALTTPRNKKRVSNPDLFQSVRIPKAVNGEARNNKVVAKALTFQSPRKVPKIKTSVELKRICAGMKKLNITGQRKNVLGYESSLTTAASKKKPGAREVKSRVYDSLHPQICKDKEIGRSLKKKSGAKELKAKCHDLVANEGHTVESSDMEVDDKSISGSSETFSLQEGQFKSTPQACTSEAAIEPGKCHNLDETTSSSSLKVGTVDEQVDSGFKGGETSENSEEKQSASSGKVEKQEESISIDQDKENHEEHFTNEYKENDSAPANNWQQNRNQGKNLLSKHNKLKKCQKFTQGATKALKENATSDAKSAPCVKHMKPRPTNPKPFRLRTDERGILKEANSEKKLITPCNEGIGTDIGHLDGNLQKQHQTLIKSKKVSGQNEDKKRNRESAVKLDKKPSERRSTTPRIRSTVLKNEGRERVSSAATLKGRNFPKQQKNQVVPSQIQPCKSTKNIKSPLANQPEQPQHVRSQLKVIMEVPTINSNPEEKAKSNKCIASTATEGTSGTTRSLSRSKRHPTIPKEPIFHTVHVPKSCIKKLG